MPQVVEGHASKSIDMLLDSASGHTFHVSQIFVHRYSCFLFQPCFNHILTSHLYSFKLFKVRECCDRLLQRLKDVEAEHKGCADKLQIAKDEADKNLKSVIVVQKEFDDFADKVQALEQRLQEEAHKAATQQIMRTRAEMMLEYQRGEWNLWDVSETVKIYNETYPDDAFPMDAFDADDNDFVKGASQDDK